MTTTVVIVNCGPRIVVVDVQQVLPLEGVETIGRPYLVRREEVKVGGSLSALVYQEQFLVVREL